MRTLTAFVFVLTLAAPVSAQDTFKQVWVTQADSGEVVRGRLIALTGDSLAMLTPDNRRVEMRLDRVLRIETRGDSLRNGAIIGAAIMGGLSVLGCQGLRGGGECVTASIVNTSLGAIIGVGVDALNAGRTAIYAKPAAPAKPAAVALAVAPAGKGARLQLKLRF